MRKRWSDVRLVIFDSPLSRQYRETSSQCYGAWKDTSECHQHEDTSRRGFGDGKVSWPKEERSKRGAPTSSAKGYPFATTALHPDSNTHCRDAIIRKKNIRDKSLSS
jgi:hypothetical protein